MIAGGGGGIGWVRVVNINVFRSQVGDMNV